MSEHSHLITATQAARQQDDVPLKMLGLALAMVCILLAVGGVVFQVLANALSGGGVALAALVCMIGIRMCILWLKDLFAPDWNQRQSEVQYNPLMPPAMYSAEQVEAWQRNTMGSELNGKGGSFMSNQHNSSYTADMFAPGQGAYAPQPTLKPTSAYMTAGASMGFMQQVPQPMFPQGPNIGPDEQSFATTTSYVPIEEDQLFALDAPVNNVRCFILSKEGEQLVECQDRYALNAGRNCYAVADGVSGSFVAGPWARIIAKNFVAHGAQFAGEDEFKQWLEATSQEWLQWIENRWVPTMNAIRGRAGERPGDWSSHIRQGSQTTLIGCSLTQPSPLRRTNGVARVFAVGDSEFFLFRPARTGEWHLVAAFPYKEPHEFGSHPDTLITIARPDLLERTWTSAKTADYPVFAGDCLVLTSDTLAKWLLGQIGQHSDLWQPFLSLTDPRDFERRVREEVHSGRMEEDDMTMLVIPIR